MDIIASQSWAYIPDLPDDIGPIRNLLLVYSRIPASDIDSHILRVREDAWRVSRFPCVGRWKFLRLTEQNDPCYRQVLFRLNVPRSNDAFLDLGCCVGQVLRQLRHDGVQGNQLFGTDVQSKFVEIGYDLFQDQDEFGATFVVGDMLDPDDTRLDDLLHKVTIIYAGSFFHLFNWTQQIYIGKRLVGFLKRGTKNALIYGRHIGTTRPGPSPLGNDMSPYLHDKDSFQRLWDEVGYLTNTKWAVEIEPAGEKIVDVPRIDRDAQPVNFVIHQIS
ncbi:S-adenosylmethionine-dependent methyltransferase family protein [Metarhizium robertsii]|uniref:S-adenosylmethionine-dependent methyltransferase family protein n=1 Tax=Metarhizium robertsii TaxID=568076 RepID=A0A0A1V8P6_9HYPO|nr:S-adenosylmethionine-dependent methyltransferase family protein [Metarhizium robertsii]